MKNLVFIFLLAFVACFSEDRVKYAEARIISHSVFDTLLHRHVSEGKVNYQGFQKDSVLFKRYTRTLKANHPGENWTKNEKMAYWINAYNAFTIELILKNYPVKSIKDISSPWDQNFIQIRENLYSLGNIEHEILRPMGDARIHFSIVCASYSCPELRSEAFRSKKLNAQLEDQAKAFVNDANRNKIAENKMEISEIFNWFSSDFDSEGGVEKFIRKYSDKTLADKIKMSYLDYNWKLNE